MHKWGKWVDIRVRVRRKMVCCWNMLFAWELRPGSSRSTDCVFYVCLLCLSDVVKRHLSFMSWPKDISICLFQIRADCQDQSHLLVLANMMQNTYVFLFRLASLQPTLSQRLSRAHLDLCTALPSIICQVSLFSSNISTNCRVKTQITLGMLVVLL